MMLSIAENFEFFMEDLLDVLVSNAIHLFELVGVIVLIAAGVRGVVNYIRHDPMVRLNLAKGMALCLEFKLGSEILRTVIVRDLSEIAIVGLLAAVVLICICAYANKPVRISAQILFCLCAIVVGDIFFYLPAVVYLALHERSWLVRLIWIAPLVGVMALNASGVTRSYGIGLQVQGSLIAEGLAAAGIADAFEVVVSVEVLLCAIAVVLAVRNLRETSEREAYRFAYDDLREGYLSLMQAAGQNTGHPQYFQQDHRSGEEVR